MDTGAGLPDKCPVCGFGAGFKYFCKASFLGKEQRHIIECYMCSSSVLWPIPTAAEFSEYYGREYFNFDRDSETGKGYYYAGLLDKIKPEGRFLEIGSALGWFLYGLKQKSRWKVYGLETGKAAAEFSRNVLGIDVKRSQLPGAGYPEGHFDFIRFNNVLEHVPNPQETFAEAARILAPGGTLYVAVPNGSIDRLDYREYERLFNRPAGSRDGHITFFSAKSLKMLAEKNSLKISGAYFTGIKRALRAMGLWPRKKGWHAVHEPRQRAGMQAPKLPEKMGPFEVPDRYYKYSLYRDLYSRLPGLSRFGSDFILYYRKV
jgi:SAM-dependent methyltransferase